MKIVNVEQGSPEWLAWRKTVITATDCPAILGSSPWVTPYKCWQKKLGLIEEQKSNEAMNRGIRLEPEARAQFIERYGFDMSPAVIESSEFDFLGASLDGISKLGNHILEIKCGGSKLHTMASSGEIPEYYMHQMQHQLLVTGAEKCFYYSYDGKHGICIEVLPDPDFKENFLSKAREFWRCVAFFEPPAMKDSDYLDKRDNLELKEYGKIYEEAEALIKAYQDKKDYARKKIIEICGDQNCIGDGIKVMKIIAKGRVCYDDIPEIKGLDLDKYRKSSTSTWRILIG